MHKLYTHSPILSIRIYNIFKQKQHNKTYTTPKFIGKFFTKNRLDKILNIIIFNFTPPMYSVFKQQLKDKKAAEEKIPSAA